MEVWRISSTREMNWAVIKTKVILSQANATYFPLFESSGNEKKCSEQEDESYTNNFSETFYLLGFYILVSVGRYFRHFLGIWDLKHARVFQTSQVLTCCHVLSWPLIVCWWHFLTTRLTFFVIYCFRFCKFCLSIWTVLSLIPASLFFIIQ